MKQLSSVALILAIFFSASCGSNTNKPSEDKPTGTTPAIEKKDKQQTDIVTNPTKPPEVNFVRQEFEGIGTIELPSGADWQRDGNTITNEKWKMVIVIQSQPESMIGQEADYLNSYNDVNVRDAEGWKRGHEELGMLKGVKIARTEGSFNNGTAMVTRDYIFFEARKTVLLQTRISETDKDFLTPMADYIAGSYQQK